MTVDTRRQLSRRTVLGLACFKSKDEAADLDALRVHFVILFRFRPIQPSISLFADEQIWKVDLLEFQLDGFDELGRYQICRLGPESHGSRQIWDSESHHDRICVSVNDFGVVIVTILHAVFCLDLLLRELDHLTTEGGGR